MQDTSGRGRIHRNDRRRRRARGARLQSRPGDLPGDRAHGRGHQARHRQLLPRRARTGSCARWQRRPTTLERWPKGVHPGIVLSTRERGGGDAFFQKRIPRGAPDYVETAEIQFPSGRDRRRDLPDRDRGRRAGRRRWARSPSTRGRSAATTSTIPTSCGSTSTPSPAPTSTTRCASPARRGRCSTSSATPASRRPPAAAASTSTSGSSRAGRSPTSATRRSRSGASSSGASTAG